LTLASVRSSEWARTTTNTKLNTKKGTEEVGSIVYVAASSREVPRVRVAIERLRAAGHSVPDWTKDQERLPEWSKRDVVDDHAHRIAFRNYHAIRESDAFVLLAPPPHFNTRDAWVEFGYALAHRIPALVSGPHARDAFAARMATRIVGHDDAIVLAVEEVLRARR